MSDEEVTTEKEEVSGVDAETREVTDGEQGSRGDAETREEQVRIPQERLDKEVGRRKEVEERLVGVEGERDALKAQVKELEEAGSSKIPLDPAYLTAAERELVETANDLEARETLLESNPDGIEGDPKLDTQAKVRTELVRVRQELRRVAGKADAAYERGKAMQMADIREGRAARLAREKAQKTPPQPETTGREKRPETTVGAGGGSAAGGEGRPKKGPDVKAFEAAGSTREAAARELGKMIPD